MVIFFADWTNVFWICAGYQETEFSMFNNLLMKVFHKWKWPLCNIFFYFKQYFCSFQEKNSVKNCVYAYMCVCVCVCVCVYMYVYIY